MLTRIPAADKDRPRARRLARCFVGPTVGAGKSSVRRVADRLDLREDVLKNLLHGARGLDSSHTGAQQGSAVRALRAQRAFLRCAYRVAERGRESLAGLSDEHPSSDVLRQARDWLVEHFDAPTADWRTEEPELARVVGEIVVRASSEPASEHALELAFLQLEQRRLEREIKAAVESSDFDRQRQLSVERSQVITRLMGSGEPSPSTTDGRG